LLDLLPGFCFPKFFPPELEDSEEKFLKRNPAKKEPGPESTTHYQLQTDRRMNVLMIDHEQTPYSDAHDCTPYNLMYKYVSHVERPRCIGCNQLFFYTRMEICSQGAYFYRLALMIE
jgi:hypothetical protein